MAIQKYLDTRYPTRFNSISDYEDNLISQLDLNSKYAYLCGHYRNLLDNIIDIIGLDLLSEIIYNKIKLENLSKID